MRYIIELENGKFASFEQEPQVHILVIGMVQAENATLLEDKEEAERIVEDMKRYNEKGFGYEDDDSDYHYYGDCLKPKAVYQVTMKMTKVEGMI